MFAVVCVLFMTCVCVPYMTYVPDAGNTRSNNAELWRFDTSTLGWEKVVNSVGPRERSDHVMTSVDLHLWLYGGLTESFDDGEGDTCSARTTLLLLRR